MSYYPTIDEDLARAKAILATGEGSGCNEYRPDHNGECLTCDEPADAHGDVSSAILGADIYAAYKLLESFVTEIEARGGIIELYERQLAERDAEVRRLRNIRPFIGDAVDLRALASAMRKVLPPALLAEVVAHLDPLTPFVAFLRTHDDSK